MKQETKMRRLERLKLEASKHTGIWHQIALLQKRKGKPGTKKVSPELRRFVYEMSVIGFAKTELAEFLNVAVPTITAWRNQEQHNRELSFAQVREAAAKITARKAQEALEENFRPRPKPVPMPEPKVVEAGTITMIRAPRRSLWQRIKDFFE